MAIPLTSCKIRDQSSTRDKQMLHLNDRLYNDSLLFSSRCTFPEVDHDPQRAFCPLVSVEDGHQERFSGTGNRILFPETAAHSAVSTERPQIMQGRVASSPVSQHLPIADELIGRGLSGEYGFLGFNELSDFWGDLRLYSQEMATHAVPPPQKIGCNEGSTPCSANGDPMAATISVELHRPSGQLSCSYPIPTTAETLGLEGTDFECRSLQRESCNHDLPWPVVTSLTSVGFDSTLFDPGSSRSSKSDGTASLPPPSRYQPEIPDKTLSALPQSAACQKSLLHPQSLARGRVQDATGVEYFREAVNNSKVASGSRQHNFLQPGSSLSTSSSPDLRRRRQPGECGIGGKAHQIRSENLDLLKLNQKSKEQSFAPRKYQKRRMLDRNDMKDEVTSIPTPLDHVQRERQRRDHMTSKIAALELLLPKSSKRDRVSVVYDAIHLLRRLEREVKDLQKKFHEKKLRRASLAPLAIHRKMDPGKIILPKSIDCSMRTSGTCFSNEVVIKRLGTYMKPVDILSQPTLGISGPSGPFQRFPMTSSFQCLGDCRIRAMENVLVEFHIHLENYVRIQQEAVLKFRCRKDYLSTLMGLVNEFELDVITCNIVKLSGYFLCVTGLKMRTREETTTAAQFAARLQSAVGVDTAREAVYLDESIRGKNLQ